MTQRLLYVPNLIMRLNAVSMSSTDQDMNAIQSEIDTAAGPLPKFDQLAGRVKEELSPTAAVTVDKRKAVVEELRRSEADYLAKMMKAQEVRGQKYCTVARTPLRHCFASHGL